MNSAFHVERADWQQDYGALCAIRQQVFVTEQHVPPDLELDDLDARSDHVLARSAAGEAIGTGRLTPEHKIGRMAVLAKWRSQGVGGALLLALLDRARERGWLHIELHAQITALPFYVRHGFTAFGDEFEEAGIRHVAMRIELLPLAPPPAVRGTTPTRPAPATLTGVTRETSRAALLQLITDTRHALACQTHDLDPALLDNDAVLTALQRVATSGRGATLRFLLHDPAEVLRSGHRLITLAQRLPSAIELRVPGQKDDLDYPSAFLVNDAGGYFLRPLAALPDGRGNTCSPREQAPLWSWFEDAWARSEPAPELRLLNL